jgi:DNA-binding transcriptional ArsR family regulator
MDLELAARRLSELGNPTRLSIFRLLVKAGPGGLAVGEIQARLGIPASTLAFHLRGLVVAGLVGQERQGRTVRCRPRYETLDQVIAFLQAECCTGFGDAAGARAGADPAMEAAGAGAEVPA